MKNTDGSHFFLLAERRERKDDEDPFNRTHMPAVLTRRPRNVFLSGLFIVM